LDYFFGYIIRLAGVRGQKFIERGGQESCCPHSDVTHEQADFVRLFEGVGKNDNTRELICFFGQNSLGQIIPYLL
jgi:hypothetical protein